MRILLFSALGLAALGCDANRPANNSPSAPTTSQNTRPAEPADRTNTGVNVRDRDSTAKTPIDQNENQPDIDRTANIRKRIVDRKLSVEATNVKVITQDGKVTLRGPVPTAEEKEAIEQIATDIAGAENVDSQLEVSGK
jgi:osmotically-inducible protein OsmY